MNKQTLPYIVIILLLCILFFQRQSCGKSSVDTIDTLLIKHDTTYIPIHDTVKGKTITLPGKVDTAWKHDSFYQPSSNCDTLLKQYNNLANNYFTVNISKTKFPIRKYGYITVYDSVYTNKVISSFSIEDFKIPEIHDTIVLAKSTPPTRQLYFGGGVFGQQEDPIHAVNIGLIYKDKKDQIYQLNVLYDGSISYGLSYYWKIKFK